MKKNKLTLDDLKVQSFVTDMGAGESQTLKGGAETILAHCQIGDLLSLRYSQCNSCGIYCPENE